VNEAHLKLCSSTEWADAVQRWIIPWVLESVDLGDDVLEIGPGPGLTTDVLSGQVERLTAAEISPDLASSLRERTDGSNVAVICADATELPVPADRFTGAVCLTMLHHVPSTARQDAVFAELHRVLRPGGRLAGQDSLASDELRELHIDDTYVPIDPATLKARLEAAGFTSVSVDTNDYAVRFRATKPGPRQPGASSGLASGGR
jgi:ubiquinone/menaquinone biosynthesis C-methylase UbiE